MIRSVWFYTIQITSLLLLIVLSGINLVMSGSQVENIFVTDGDNAINATSQYIFILFFNVLILFKLITEFFPGLTFFNLYNDNLVINKTELYSTMILRNFTSLLSFSIGMIVFGNMLSLCGLCDWMYMAIPLIALISDVINNHEDLIATQSIQGTIRIWFNPVKLTDRSFWIILLLYIMNLGAFTWGFVAYYLQNTDTNKQRFEEKNAHIMYYICVLLLLIRFVVLLIGRWFKPDRTRLSQSELYTLVNADPGLVTFGTAINAPIFTYILDMLVLAGVATLIGTLETLTFDFTNKRYIILLNDLTLMLMVVKITFGKNKV